MKSNSNTGETQMNSRKRIFWIVALSALLFAAVAVGPVYKRSLIAVHANQAQANQAKAAPDIVILVCSEPGESPDPEPGVLSVDSTNPQVTLPQTGNSCAQALRTLYGQGFVRQDYSGEAIQWHVSGGLGTSCYYLTACSVEKIFQWVLIRGGGSLNAQ
jgi:hypothetical protein